MGTGLRGEMSGAFQTYSYVTEFGKHLEIATRAATNPRRTPLPTPMLASFNRAFRELLQVNSPSPMPRTMTVSVCVAAVAPIPATIGMKIASAVTVAIVGSNIATTAAAANKVAS